MFGDYVGARDSWICMMDMGVFHGDYFMGLAKALYGIHVL